MSPPLRQIFSGLLEPLVALRSQAFGVLPIGATPKVSALALLVYDLQEVPASGRVVSDFVAPTHLRLLRHVAGDVLAD